MFLVTFQSIINFSCQLHGRVITCSGKELKTMRTVQMPCFGKQRCHETNSKFCVSKSFKAINKPYMQIKNVKNKFSYNEAYVSAIDNKIYFCLFLKCHHTFCCKFNNMTGNILISKTFDSKIDKIAISRHWFLGCRVINWYRSEKVSMRIKYERVITYWQLSLLYMTNKREPNEAW